jgi:hypothetical protein
MDGKEYAQASLKRALQGNATANMRAVVLGLKPDGLFIRFVLHLAPDGGDAESIGIITTEVMADYDHIIIEHDTLVDSNSPAPVLIEGMQGLDLVVVFVGGI